MIKNIIWIFETQRIRISQNLSCLFYVNEHTTSLWTNKSILLIFLFTQYIETETYHKTTQT